MPDSTPYMLFLDIYICSHLPILKRIEKLKTANISKGLFFLTQAVWEFEVEFGSYTEI